MNPALATLSAALNNAESALTPFNWSSFMVMIFPLEKAACAVS